MTVELMFNTVLIVIIGTILLRIAGRKSIAQMTAAETIIMIAIGSLLIQPVTGRGLWPTFAVATVMVLTLLGMEYLQLKSNLFEKYITGKSKVVIENGVVNEQNLKKVRVTVDQLEMQLRQSNIRNIEDVQIATIEPNGRLGFTLKESAQPATKADIQQLVDLLTYGKPTTQPTPLLSGQQDNIFTEIDRPNQQELKSPRRLH